MNELESMIKKMMKYDEIETKLKDIMGTCVDKQNPYSYVRAMGLVTSLINHDESKIISEIVKINKENITKKYLEELDKLFGKDS